MGERIDCVWEALGGSEVSHVLAIDSQFVNRFVQYLIFSYFCKAESFTVDLSSNASLETYTENTLASFVQHQASP